MPSSGKKRGVEQSYKRDGATCCSPPEPNYICSEITLYGRAVLYLRKRKELPISGARSADCFKCAKVDSVISTSAHHGFISCMAWAATFLETRIVKVCSKANIHFDTAATLSRELVNGAREVARKVLTACDCTAGLCAGLRRRCR